MNLIDIVENSAKNYPDKVAIISQKENLTYAELQSKINAFASYFLSSGINPHDNVAFVLGNCVDFIISFFAISKLGGVVVPVNPAYREEMNYIFQDAEVVAVITSSKFKSKVENYSSGVKTLRNIIITENIKGEKKDEIKPYRANEDDTAVMIYTNAYKGYPMGAMLTHRNLMSDIKQSKKIVNATENDKFISALPFFHAFGLTVNIGLSFFIGGSTVVVERFSPQTILDMIEKEKVTIFVGVPVMFGIMSTVPKDYDLSSVRVWISGGAKLTQEIREKFEKKFDTEIREGYGITEASPVCTLNNPFIKNKHGSIGMPYPDVKAKIVDEDGKELPHNEIGELIIFGENVMKGYYKKEEETRKFLKDGWLYTGDLGYKDEDGYIFLTGVKKKILICGGFNIYTEELRRILLSHPKIEDVEIKDIPDVLYGQFPKAEVKLKKGENATSEEIINFCKERIAPYKVPKEVIFI